MDIYLSCLLQFVFFFIQDKIMPTKNKVRNSIKDGKGDNKFVITVAPQKML